MTIHTCRFCGKWASENSIGQPPFIRYGKRHWACQPCYLDHKSLDDLSNWQIGTFAYRLLKERGLLEVAERRLATNRRTDHVVQS